jgi:radical SAM superfamily enzyme YgiQ (UPF0313 family)
MTYDGYLPISKEDLEERGIDQLDFVYVIGDAYVDHPSFGHAIISRILESHGYSIGIISQPDWKNKESISILGKPKLGFLVMGGNMDSMVTIILFQKKEEQLMHLLQVELWVKGQIMQLLFIVI